MTIAWSAISLIFPRLPVVRSPDQGTPQNFGETILLHFLVDMMVLIKNQEGVEL